MRPASPAVLAYLRTAIASETPATLRLHPRPLSAACLRSTRPLSYHRFQSTQASPSQQSASSTTPPQPQTSSQEQTHYTFFPQALPSGPPPQGPFNIDLSALKREFLQLQAKVHPDRHAQENKKKAEALSARINEAYKTLQSPLLRSQYLLSLRGIDVSTDETLKTEDPELLMEVLEVREKIEEVETEEGLEPMKEENARRIEESGKVLEKAFEDGDIDTAKEEAVRLRYWQNIKDSLDGWEKGKPVVLQH